MGFSFAVVKINKSRNTHKHCCNSFHRHWAIVFVEERNGQTVRAGWNPKLPTMKDLLLPGSEGEWERDGEGNQEGIPHVIYWHTQRAFTAIKAIPSCRGTQEIPLMLSVGLSGMYPLTAPRDYCAVTACIVVPLLHINVILITAPGLCRGSVRKGKLQIVGQ